MRIALLLILFIVIIKVFWKDRGAFSGKFILMFALVWFLEFFLVAVDASNVGGVRLEIFSLVLASVLSFIIAFKNTKKNDADAENSQLQVDNRIDALFSIKLVNIGYIALLGYVVMNLRYVLPILLAAGNMGGGLRVDSLTGNLYPPFFYLINVYVLAPAYNMSLPLMAYLFISGKHKFSFLLTLLFCILYPSLFGGRMSFFIMGFIILICYLWFISGKLNLIRQGFNKYVSIMAAGIVALFVVMSIAKSGDVSNFKQSFEDIKEDLVTQPLKYFLCPAKAFEYAIDYDYPQRMGGYMHGRATLAAVDYFINPIINVLNGTHDPNANSIIGHVIQDEYISFSTEVESWNALYTAFLHFYLDFGWIGCILVSFFFGIIASKACSSVVRTGSLPLFILSFFILSKSIMSVMSYYPVAGDVVPFLIYLVIWRTIEKRTQTV